MENPATRALRPDFAFDASSFVFGNRAPAFPVRPSVAGAPRLAAPPVALLLASTPLHSFWALGLAHGPLRRHDCVLAMIDQREGDRDFIAEAVAERGLGPIREVLRFPRIGKSPLAKIRGARSVLAQVAEASRRLQPSRVVVGNDRRAEFYAALSQAPEAVGGYIDDGMFSYMPMPRGKTSPWLEAVSGGLRRQLYGLPVEHPRFVGGAGVTREAWVMLPDLVHEGLRAKSVNRIEPSWFQEEGVQQICADAVARAGVDPALVRSLRLLLLLPHESFLRQHPELARHIGDLARAALARGQSVGFKRHPRSTSTDTGLLPEGCMEISRRLPVEILAPLLQGTLVVGALTTGLLSLKHLGMQIEVRSLTQLSAQPASAAVYAAAGIVPLEGAV